MSPLRRLPESAWRSHSTASIAFALGSLGRGDGRDSSLLVITLVTALVAFLAVAWLSALRRRRAALDSLASMETHIRAIQDQDAVGIARITLDGRFVQVNPALCRMLGYAEPELLARGLRDVSHPEDLPALELDLRKTLLGGANAAASPEAETRLLCRDGSPLWVTTSLTLARDAALKPAYFVSVVQDVTRRRELEERLVQQANFDSLTQLPNRRLFYERLEQAVSLARRKRRIASVLFIDLDRFKQVNDTFGHEAGDDLLAQAALRIKGSIRLEDATARLGGDEFAVILCELNGERDAARVAQKIVDALAQPFELDGQPVFVTASIGVGIFPLDSEDADTLVKHADAAMLRAKAQGRNNYRFYAAEMNERRVERVQMDASLHRALERDELQLYLQPKLSLTSGEISGVEALLRWRHPERGVVLPAEFLPTLEDSDLMAVAGEWVIAAACRQIRDWQDAGLTPVPIAVNLSARQLQEQDPSALVARGLLAHGVEARWLELEIPEPAAMQDAANAFAAFDRLAEAGVRPTIAAFGSGYSNLGWLQRLAPGALKLDRSLVGGLPADPGSARVTVAAIAMAHSLGARVVGEGVETREQLDFLGAHGCDEVQGFYFCRPLPPEDCTEFLRQHRTRFASDSGLGE